MPKIAIICPHHSGFHFLWRRFSNILLPISLRFLQFSSDGLTYWHNLDTPSENKGCQIGNENTRDTTSINFKGHWTKMVQYKFFAISHPKLAEITYRKLEFYRLLKRKKSSEKSGLYFPRLPSYVLKADFIYGQILTKKSKLTLSLTSSSRGKTLQKIAKTNPLPFVWNCIPFSLYSFYYPHTSTDACNVFQREIKRNVEKAAGHPNMNHAVCIDKRG